MLRHAPERLNLAEQHRLFLVVGKQVIGQRLDRHQARLRPVRQRRAGTEHVREPTLGKVDGMDHLFHVRECKELGTLAEVPNPITTLSRSFAPERQETHLVVERNVDASDSGRLLLPANVKVDRVNLLQGVHDAGLTGDIFGSSQLQDGRDTISMIRSEPLYPAALIIRLEPATLCDPCRT